MRRRRVPAPTIERSAFAGYRFPPDVIILAVRWYLRYGLSYRDIEELLAERRIVVDHVSVYHWVQTFTPLLVGAARCRRHGGGDRWFVDETYVKVSGRWMYLHRCVDQFGQVIDVMLADKRDLPAARRFFRPALSTSSRPVEVNTDLAGGDCCVGSGPDIPSTVKTTPAPYKTDIRPYFTPPGRALLIHLR